MPEVTHQAVEVITSSPGQDGAQTCLIEHPNHSMEHPPVQELDAHSEPLGPELSEQSTENTEISRDTVATDRKKRLSMGESIGSLGLLAIIGGTVACLASVGFLIFLWTGAGSSREAVDASHAWRAIVLNGWVAQATTLTSLLIRTVVAAQATVCTAMLASLFLERRQVLKSSSAQFSVLRAVNDGPLKLVQLVWKSGSISPVFCRETVLLVILALVTLALQFASTILLSDLHDSKIVADAAPSLVNDYIDGEVAQFYVPNPRSNTQINAVYGELPPYASPDPDSKGFSISGPRKRSFLPLLETNNRTSIQHYEGNAVVLSTNTACLRPIMRTNYRGTVKELIQDQGVARYGLLGGTLFYGQSLQNATSVDDLCSSEGCYTTEFNCSIAGGRTKAPDWQGTLCLVDAVGGDFQPNGLSTGLDSTRDPWSNHSAVYLMIFTNMFGTDWEASQESRSLEVAPTTEFGEWNSYEILEDRFVNVSLCFSSYYANLAFVDMVATGDLTEPQDDWSVTGVSNSSEALKYYGISERNSSLADRGLLTILNINAPDILSPLVDVKDANQSKWLNHSVAEKTAGDFEDGIATVFITPQGPGLSNLALCTVCDIEAFGMDPGLTGLLQNTVAKTGRAVDVLEVYLASTANSFYNVFLQSFNGTEEVMVTYTKAVQLVGGCQGGWCKGLISVSVLIAIHLLCIAATTYTYVNLTGFSRQGDVWHAVAQLNGPELKTALERGNDQSDSSLKEELDEQGSNVLVALKRLDNGNIGITSDFEQSK
ncbi:hypothetical protein F4777DRAFT_572250 [Nemania sp. FL0916]|nr:hypothetical protein F4777DRAFT_572250 [Nemania sp. FL0916]